MSHIPSGWSVADVKRYLRAENRKWSAELKEVPRESWPPMDRQSQQILTRVLRSKTFMVQVFVEGAHVRLSVNRTEVNGKGQWVDGITWDELMRLKREAGYGDRWAVEVYPADGDTVNVANMRHLFVLSEAPAYAWKRH